MRHGRQRDEGHTLAAPAANDLVGLASVRGSVGGGGELAHVVGVIVFIGVGHLAQVDGHAGAVHGARGGAFKVPSVGRVVGVRGSHSETRGKLSEVIGVVGARQFDGGGAARRVEGEIGEGGEGEIGAGWGVPL